MFSIAYRYILKRLATTFFMVTPIIVLMAWVTMSIKYIGFIVSDSIPLSTFFKLVLCISPGVCGIVLPICFLIAAIITINAMQNNKEIIVFMTSGKSALSMLLPIMTLGGCISMIVLYMQTTGAPRAYRILEAAEEKIKTQISTNLLKPQVFNTLGDSVVYVGKNEGTVLRDIFVSHIPKKAPLTTNIITAKIGALLSNKDGVFIYFKDGCRQELDSSQNLISTLRFESLSYDITRFFKRYYPKSNRVSRYTQDQLLKEARQTSDETKKRNCLAEYHARILGASLPILNALFVGIFLLVAFERGRGKYKAIPTFFTGIACHILVMLLLNSATKYSDMIMWNYVIITCMMVGLFSIFLRRN